MVRPRRNSGVALVYSSIVIGVMMVMVTFAVDYGHIRLAKSQLQDAVDAAARAAAIGLSDNTQLAKAQAIASENTVDGEQLTLSAGDIETGVWDSTACTFTAGGSTPNAVRVTGRRTAARGTPIRLIFGQAVGTATVDVTVSTIATANSTNVSYDIVGTNNVTLSGATFIKRLASESGTVKVATNGTSSAPWSCYIYGDVYYRGSAPSEPGNGITGTTAQMSTDVSYAAVSAPGGATNLGAVDVGWQSGTIPAGNYVCSSITLGGGGAYNVTGDVNIYCSGAISIGNGATINTNGTANKLTIYMTGSNTADINMSSTFYCRFYGPSATLNLNGSSPMVGSVMVRSLNINGSANISYSSALPIPIAPTGGDGGGGSSSGAATVATVQ